MQATALSNFDKFYRNKSSFEILWPQQSRVKFFKVFQFYRAAVLLLFSDRNTIINRNTATLSNTVLKPPFQPTSNGSLWLADIQLNLEES